MMAVFFFTAHKKGFKFHAQPQTGAYSCYLSRVCCIIICVVGFWLLVQSCGGRLPILSMQTFKHAMTLGPPLPFPLSPLPLECIVSVYPYHLQVKQETI